ncbi:hypothetical protein CFE70_001423 [Pyrenophora teres f. teres 0-1]|uniref:Uncharacterized protein n=2 Tax=Pyrenophora teres f. teres TaxID=97479 RepID=E3S0U2_PYRTT|nr:hypothetical protein PTT_15728 [Pyrenophora teres f. teres 0-1]KAE8841972.1 hypothetical protein HRS9139_01269 [Pyrenophora teres f. teres]CAA9956741.1 hypothetical protein PTMSG1_00349 [Pyrenophora teres f. maculata]KAE8850961.1 hypothetical protein PTNB85_01377 [Pyrenophora teres f. teres]KAE8851007.1 hypothetical protein HRS9122_01294 [Pyrenophora teres f. teres]
MAIKQFQDLFSTTAGRRLGTGQEVTARQTKAKNKTNDEEYRPLTDVETESDDDGVEPDYDDKIVAERDTFDDLDNEDDDEDEQGQEEQEEEREGPGEEEEADTKAKKQAVNSENVPRRGDQEEIGADGKVILIKGSGIKNRKTILMGVIGDARYEQSRVKARLNLESIIERAEDNATGRMQSIHNFADEANRGLKRNPGATDYMATCLIGGFNDTGGAYQGRAELNDEYLKQGYHPLCRCGVCRNRKKNDEMSKAREALARRMKAERARRETERTEKDERRELRKASKVLRSGKKANEGCPLNEDWHE